MTSHPEVFHSTRIRTQDQKRFRLEGPRFLTGDLKIRQSPKCISSSESHHTSRTLMKMEEDDTTFTDHPAIQSKVRTKPKLSCGLSDDVSIISSCAERDDMKPAELQVRRFECEQRQSRYPIRLTVSEYHSLLRDAAIQLQLAAQQQGSQN